MIELKLVDESSFQGSAGFWKYFSEAGKRARFVAPNVRLS